MGEKKKTRFRLWLIDWLFPALYGFFLVWRQEQCGAWRADRTNHYTASDRRFVITFYFWLFYGCRLVTKQGNIAVKWTNTSSSELVLSFFLTEDHTLHHFNNLELFWLPFEHDWFLISFPFFISGLYVTWLWFDAATGVRTPPYQQSVLQLQEWHVKSHRAAFCWHQSLRWWCNSMLQLARQ